MHPSPLLERADAVAGAPQDVDATVPAHYGSPLPEQAALVAGLALSALARDVVAVTGPDRRSWLTTLSSQVLTHLAPGDGGVETLLMDAQGHITHALAALDDGQVLWLVTEAGAGPALADFLDSMRFMLRVEATDRPDVQVLGAMGQGLEALEEAARSVNLPDPHAGTALVGTWRDPWPGVVEGGTSYDLGRTRPHPGQDYRAGMVLVPRDAVTQVAEAFLGEEAPDGRRLAGALAWEALRVEAGRPRAAREVDARTIAHELDWLRTAVHLNKGCYPGQETIARTLNLGRPPRRLTILQLDGLGGRARPRCRRAPGGAGGRDGHQRGTPPRVRADGPGAAAPGGAVRRRPERGPGGARGRGRPGACGRHPGDPGRPRGPGPGEPRPASRRRAA